MYDKQKQSNITACCFRDARAVEREENTHTIVINIRIRQVMAVNKHDSIPQRERYCTILHIKFPSPKAGTQVKGRRDRCT